LIKNIFIYNLTIKKKKKAYQKEENIRLKYEKSNSPELACVKNCLASCYGNLKGELERGLSMIEEVL
jgi:hypothetical protein